MYKRQPDTQPVAPGAEPTCLLLRRQPDGRVHFSQLSPLALRLLELIDETQASGRGLLERLAEEARIASDAEFLRQGAQMLVRMHDESVLLGIRPGSASLSR